MKKDDIYIKAAKILMEDGWCKGGLRNHDWNYCVLGATRMAKYGTIYPGYRDEGPLFPTDGAEEFAAVKFNDAPDTTKEDVLTLLCFMSAAHKDVL